MALQSAHTRRRAVQEAISRTIISQWQPLAPGSGACLSRVQAPLSWTEKAAGALEAPLGSRLGTEPARHEAQTVQINPGVFTVSSFLGLAGLSPVQLLTGDFTLKQAACCGLTSHPATPARHGSEVLHVSISGQAACFVDVLPSTPSKAIRSPGGGMPRPGWHRTRPGKRPAQASFTGAMGRRTYADQQPRLRRFYYAGGELSSWAIRLKPPYNTNYSSTCRIPWVRIIPVPPRSGLWRTALPTKNSSFRDAQLRAQPQRPGTPGVRLLGTSTRRKRADPHRLLVAAFMNFRLTLHLNSNLLTHFALNRPYPSADVWLEQAGLVYPPHWMIGTSDDWAPRQILKPQFRYFIKLADRGTVLGGRYAISNFPLPGRR